MKDRRIKRRKVSYLSTTVSITLVLFLVGLFTLMVYHANQIKNILKENVQVSINFMDDVNEPDIFKIKNRLEEKKSIRSIEYISKEKAQKIMAEKLGEDADEILGYNPYPPSLDIYFNAGYIHPDTLNTFKNKWEANNKVRDVFYQEVVVNNIDRFVRIAGLIVLSLAVIFLLIAVALINSTIRLNLYAKRFLIKSMQLVGATRWFIRKPFILRSMAHGLIGGLIATLLLILVVYFFQGRIPVINFFNHFTFYLAVSGMLLVLGVLITGFSSLFSINKYLKMKLEDLY